MSAANPFETEEFASQKKVHEIGAGNIPGDGWKRKKTLT